MSPTLESGPLYTDLDQLWSGYEDLLIGLGRRTGATTVAELGGGANPLVADEARWGFAPERVVLDISADELGKAPGNVRTRVADLCRPLPDGHGAYDLVFSKMLCEHIGDPRTFHRNCFDLLRPGGHAVHFFPTLMTVPFVINRLIPEELARSVLGKVQPHRISDPRQEKFPAYYRWCTGPTSRATRRFESVGFEVECWHATFGHTYYRPVAPLHRAELAKTRLLHQHPSPYLTSFAVVVLRKPE
ncbi:class I SAM-dependent methyltransferase [Nocardioides panacisoli]|uniref:Methyltransferase type 11 domain-containing protein n=1 Tax=Nocardioides panacisoli TaxID=627624 RepID=A0ABP7IQS1_9ACTN